MSNQSGEKPGHDLSLPGAIEQQAEINSHGVAFQQQHGIQVYLTSPQGLEMLTPSYVAMSVQDWPLIGNINDPIRLGIHPAANQQGNRSPRYVERDIDKELERISHDGTFILIIGDSTSGKSRTAYELIRKKFPSYKLLNPSDGEQLLQMSILIDGVGPCVLWLDDVERFLGAGGLNVGVLDRFLDMGAIVMATMRAEEYANFGPLAASRDSGKERSHRRTFTQILEQANIIHLPRLWSSSEINRAAQSPDTRVAEATQHSSLYGIAEYLAAGPQLLAEWRAAYAPGAHPRGATLVAVAVDARRAGFFAPIPLEVIEELHHYYLSQHGGPLLRPEELAEALEWAFAPLHATSSLLLPAENEMCFAFDYLVDAEQRKDNPSPIPDVVWRKVLEITSEDDLPMIGIAADYARRVDIAEEVFGRLAELGDKHGMFHLGLIHYNRKEFEEAESSFKAAAEAGDVGAAYYVGEFLAKRDEYDDAENWLRIAMKQGRGFTRRRATAELGYVEALRERWTSAEDLLRTAMADGGDGVWFKSPERGVPTEAQHSMQDFDRGIRGFFAYIYAVVLQTLNKREEAERWYRHAAELDARQAANNLGLLLQEDGRDAEAGEWLYKGAMAGDALAALNYGDLLYKKREYAKAKLWYRRTFQDGNSAAAVELGRIYSGERDVKRARQWFSKAIEAGNPRGSFNLGMLLESQGQNEKAGKLYAEAADGGLKHAIVHVGMIKEKEGDDSSAERFYREIVDDDPTALAHLGELLWRHGNTSEAREKFALAKEKGDPKADRLLSAIDAGAEPPARELQLPTPPARRPGRPRSRSRKRK